MNKSLPPILAELDANKGSPEDLAGMARFGINTKRALGVRMPIIRGMAKRIGTDHGTARSLWDTAIHEPRLLATLVGEPSRVSEREMEAWVAAFDSWDLCDGLMGNLYTRCNHAWDKAEAWSRRGKEFVKRSGFVLPARLAIQDKSAPDERFLAWLPIIEREAGDRRNFVKKAVNWALRQIGKRNHALNQAAIACARRIAKQDSKSAGWIAGDALRELTGAELQARFDISRR